MKITEEVIMLEVMGAHYFLVFDEELILIDTGLPFVGKQLVRELEKLTIEPKQIKHILLTHHDLDHIGNIKMLKDLSGATIWAHQDDIPYISGAKERASFKKYIGKLGKKNRLQNIKAYPAKMMINNIKIISTPGHTPGHVCMLYKDVLFVGDLVENKRGEIIPYPKAWNWNQTLLEKSLKTVNTYSFNWLCTAHGKPMKQSYLPTY